MIPFAYYIQSNFLNKEVVIDCSDVRQYTGVVTKVHTDNIAVLPRNKKTPMFIPVINILMIQEVEK